VISISALARLLKITVGLDLCQFKAESAEELVIIEEKVLLFFILPCPVTLF
jgi:hypothetical protein